MEEKKNIEEEFDRIETDYEDLFPLNPGEESEDAK